MNRLLSVDHLSSMQVSREHVPQLLPAHRLYQHLALLQPQPRSPCLSCRSQDINDVYQVLIASLELKETAAVIEQVRMGQALPSTSSSLTLLACDPPVTSSQIRERSE